MTERERMKKKSIVCQKDKMDSENDMQFKLKQQEQNSWGLSDLYWTSVRAHLNVVYITFKKR